MRTDKDSNEQPAFLFNVDLLVHGESNAIALERLLHALNQCQLADFRIISGVQLGQLITALEETQATVKPSADKPRTAKKDEILSADKPSVPAAVAKAKAAAAPAIEPPLITDSIKLCIAENRLIRLTVNKGFGIKLSIPCRVINFEDKNGMLTVYHVDEKQVYTFTLNEIDDLLLN
ncbi:hypothetical protein PAECIP111893_01374 [Paenibacillus plantiphilus]|uniref:Uncharacterized protein n=1 Tax=Paenibacillus plantiphilus TaxID=2905650 RepID=A0ABN8G9J4_9BACL|nr:hypothetical protein [Paenibacillus plantiphilus]CAH1200429.1 hypothetical protein PAECIP111893_01374 [Paenibacillus plantiphilus]